MLAVAVHHGPPSATMPGFKTLLWERGYIPRTLLVESAGGDGENPLSR